MPVKVTGAADATVCGAPALAVGAPIGGLTVTVVVTGVDDVPLLTVRRKPSVTAASPMTSVGAVKVAAV